MRHFAKELQGFFHNVDHNVSTMCVCVCVCFCLSSQDADVTASTNESHTWKQESWVFVNYKQKTFLMRKPKLGGKGSGENN